MPAAVLVVDDSMSARFALSRALEPHGVEITTAKDAEEALGTVRKSRFDLIFMDQVLPGMSGLEAVQKIRSLPPYAKTPIIMCSSNDDADFRQQARQCGANGLLPKPPQPAVLARLLDQHLRSPEQTPTPTPPTPTAEIENHDMNDDAKLQALDARIERLEQLLERVEKSVAQIDGRSAAIARIVAERAGRELANRLLRAVVSLKGQ